MFEFYSRNFINIYREIFVIFSLRSSLHICDESHDISKFMINVKKDSNVLIVIQFRKFITITFNVE